MYLYDSHVHSICSHDGSLTATEQATFAKEKGLNGICITDHFDMVINNNVFDASHIEKCRKDVESARQHFKDTFSVDFGVEIGDYYYNKSIAQKCVKTFDFDFVIGSLHSRHVGKSIIENYSGFQNFKTMTSSQDRQFMEKYFKVTLESVWDKNNDFDAWAHLTYPIRYITSVNRRSVNICDYDNIIADILTGLIEREKSLEINTSCLNSDWKYTLPSFDIIKTYFNLGGRLITLGSDSHMSERLGLGFNEVINNLREIGFTEYYKYIKRKPVAISLD